MVLAYMSITGQTKRFVNKLDFKTYCIDVHDMSKIQSLGENYVLILPTYDLDTVKKIEEFIEFGTNIHFLKGVIGSGNRNFDKEFCISAKYIAKKYNIPLLHCFEFHGQDADVDIVRNEVNKIG